MYRLDQRGVMHLIPILIVLIGIVASVYLVQKTQIFKPKANEGNKVFQILNGGGEAIEETITTEVNLKIILPQGWVLPGEDIQGSTHVLQGLYIENKDTDGSNGGHEQFYIVSHYEDYLYKPIYWKLNHLNKDQIETNRVIQLTLFDGENYVPFTKTIKLTRKDPQGVIHLNSCFEITQAGDYVLDDDIVGNPDEVCISIHDVSNINLNCNNHSIKSEKPKLIDNYTHQNNHTRQILVGTLLIKNVNQFTIKSCHFPSNGEKNLDEDNIAVYQSVNGTIISNTIEKHEVFVKDSKNIYFKDNILTSASYYQHTTDNSVIDNNKITLFDIDDKFYSGGLINSDGGFGNQITNNIIDGKSDGIFGHLQGPDDGIILGDEGDILTGERAAIVKNNTISNTYDCGIETAGLVQDAIISNNKIDNTGVCGIGGWYGNSWVKNRVSDNTVNNSPKLFHIYHWARLADEKTAYLLPGETIRFKDNIFEDNKLTNKKSTSLPTLIDMKTFNTPEDKLILSNNILKDNDFGSSDIQPRLNPGSMFIDGGGNICKQGSEKDFPLKCISFDSSSTRTQSVNIQDTTKQTEEEIRQHLELLNRH